MAQDNVVVIGGNHHNTLGVVRSLGYKGIRPFVILVTNQTKPYVSYSRYIQHFHILSSTEDIVPYLLEIKECFTKKTVVISCADFVTAVLDSNQNKLSSFYFLPVGKGDIINVMDKDNMSSIATACGLEMPKRVPIDDISFLGKEKYIIKPLKSIEGSKSDICIVHTKEELTKYLNSVHCRNLQVQEFIEKDLEFQLIGCSLNGGNNIVIPGASVIMRQPDNTNTGFLKYVGFDHFDYKSIENCKKFIQHIGYSGLFSLEFLRGKNGKDYFMEINMRNDGNSICVTAAGVNLPYIWYCHCIGLEIWKEESRNKIKDTIVMPEFDDFVNVIKRRVSLFSWIKDIRRTDCFMEYDKTDTKPFYVGLRRQLTNYLKLIFGKIHIIK